MITIVRKMLLGFIAVCVILITISITTYLNMSMLVNRTNLDDYSLSILKTIENIHLNSLDIETGMRGFLIVGDTSYLKPFKKGKYLIKSELDTLISITEKYKKHEIDAKELKVYSTLLISVSEELVSYEYFKSTDTLKRKQLLYQSKRNMDGIRAIITHIEETERLILRQTAKENVNKAIITKYGFITTTFLSILILILVFIIVRKELLARLNAERKLQHSSARVLDLYNNAPCGYHSVGKNNLFVDINYVELDWVGNTRDEVVGKKTIYDFLVPEDHHKIKTFIEQLNREKTNAIKDLEVNIYVRMVLHSMLY